MRHDFDEAAAQYQASRDPAPTHAPLPTSRALSSGRAQHSKRREPSPRYLREVKRSDVREDLRTLAFFVQIYCDGNHHDHARVLHESAAVDDGVYTNNVPFLCTECSAHLEYGEARRVFCALDPKPFCARCEVHCFKSEERQWNRVMMRYAGPRALFHGYASVGARHFVGSVRARLPRFLGGKPDTPARR